MAANPNHTVSRIEYYYFSLAETSEVLHFKRMSVNGRRVNGDITTDFSKNLN